MVLMNVSVNAPPSAPLNGILLWWEALLAPGVTLGTGIDSPYATQHNAHWKQQVQPLTSAEGIATKGDSAVTIAVYGDGFTISTVLESVNGVPVPPNAEIGVGNTHLGSLEEGSADEL